VWPARRHGPVREVSKTGHGKWSVFAPGRKMPKTRPDSGISSYSLATQR
jgi:hypothetical protein